MPKIPVMTAQGQGALLRLPAANADALGGRRAVPRLALGRHSRTSTRRFRTSETSWIWRR